MPDRPSTGQANQRAPHAGDRRSYPVLIDLHLQPVLNNANQACPGLRGALPVTGPQSWGHQSAAGGRVRHTVLSVSRRPEDSLGDISLLQEGVSDTQCHRFHCDRRTVLGRVRHKVPSVSLRPEDSLGDISLLQEGESDTQCHRFHGDRRTVLGRVRHIVPSVSLRPEDSLGDISLLLEGGSDTNSKHWFTTSFLQEAAGKRCSECGSDTQCHRFHGDPRTVL